MIKDAFKPEWWSGSQYVRIESDGSRTLRSPSILGSWEELASTRVKACNEC